jgi:phage shock protein PspC (stress-responsive transcriptional regulator)
MRRVVTVSLNGNAFQLEEEACTVLSSYLDAAARTLVDDPDRTEIIADLEQAIADKCQRFLGVHKSVLTRAEIDQVTAEMGPVDGSRTAATGASQSAAGNPASGAAGGTASGPTAEAAAQAGTTAPGTGGHAPRRLYLVREGAMLGGLCNGIAAYFNLDVTVVRVVAVLLAFLSWGVAAVIYTVLIFVVPEASTSEERATAHGLPFNAQLLVERAKQKYQQFTNGTWQKASSEWRREWRRSRRHARAEWRATKRQARHEWRAAFDTAPPATTPVHYGAHVIGRTLAIVVGIATALFVLVWLGAFLSFVTTGAFFGLVPPFHAPFWVVVVLMFVAYGMVIGPLHAVRHAAGGAAHYPRHPWLAALDGIIMLAVLVALIFYASHHMPEVREFFGHLNDAIRGATRAFTHGTDTRI